LKASGDETENPWFSSVVIFKDDLDDRDILGEYAILAVF